MTSETSTPVTGAATTITDTYPAAGSAQPHALTAQKTAASSGTTTTSYGYNADGDTTSVASTASSQSLNWNDAGQLASVATTGGNAGTSSYVYDASGNLLLQTDPGAVTLYLPDEQLVENTATGAVTGTRYYTIGGVTVAARTSAGDVQYLTGNQQGTDTLAIDYSTLNVTRRYYDPYGNPIGATPTAWPGTKGFVGGTADPATGLTNLGAREYSPGTGAFISPDSLINAYNPQDLNAYAYAVDNPTTDEDPSGQMPCADGICGSFQYLESHLGGGGGGGGGTHRSSPVYYNPVVFDPLFLLPPLFDFLPPLLLPPPPPPVHRTVRSVTATQHSSGLPSCQGGRAQALDPQPCTPAPMPSGGGFNPISWVGRHWRGLAQGAVDVVAAVGTGFCIAATDGACAGLLPQVFAAVGAINYSLSGGRHTAGGYAKALGEGALLGTAAAACVLICFEAAAALPIFGGGEVGLGAVTRDINYAQTPGPHSIGGYVRESVLGAVENGPYPVDRLFGNGE
jgi:RHS repeat-associated protein